MGNQDSQTPSTERKLEIYQKLINMGFDENKSMDAATAHPYNFENALNFMLESNDNSKKKCHTKSANIDDQKNMLAQHKHTEITNDDIKNCKELERLIEALKYHQIYQNKKKNNHNDNDKISEYLNMNKHVIINDYHYILSKYLNEDNVKESIQNGNFQMIYNIITAKNHNLFCDVSKCEMYKRNNRERERDRNDNDSSVLRDILDSIHCYFLHSVDIGYRIIDQIKNNERNVIDKECADKQLFALKAYLKSKRQKLQQIRGINRIKNNKFLTNFNNKSDEKKTEPEDENNIDDGTEQKSCDYGFGLRFRCGQKWEWHYDYTLTPKYSSLKEELISNSVYKLERNVFDGAYSKAQCLLVSSETIKAIKSVRVSICDDFRVKIGLSLNVDNILAIILYTDYDTLSHKFSTIFRKTKGKESDKYLIQRAREYFHWIQILTKTVNCFGTATVDSNINRLYHGVSLLYINKFIAQFNSPTSTTTKLSVAINFAKNDGIILELAGYVGDPRGHETVYFNCSMMSYFGNEDERLFIQPPRNSQYYLKFVGIRNMKTDENYTYFINVLSMFQKLITGHNLKSKVASEYIETMNHVIDASGNMTNEFYPDYIIKSFKKWSDGIFEMKIKVNHLKKYCKTLKFFDKDCDKLIRYDKINKVFRNVTKIQCSVWRLSDGLSVGSYLMSVLSVINLLTELHFSKLNEIKINLTAVNPSELAKCESCFVKNGWKIEITDFNDSLLIRR